MRHCIQACHLGCSPQPSAPSTIITFLQPTGASSASRFAITVVQTTNCASEASGTSSTAGCCNSPSRTRNLRQQIESVSFSVLSSLSLSASASHRNLSFVSRLVSLSISRLLHSFSPGIPCRKSCGAPAQGLAYMTESRYITD